MTKHLASASVVVTLLALGLNGLAAAPASLELSPLYRVNVTSQSCGLSLAPTQTLADASSVKTNPVAFLAVTRTSWTTGLIPLFEVEKQGRVHLRRRPSEGQESFTDPLFFALPGVEEEAATHLAGRWECVAEGAQRAKHHFSIELTTEGNRVVGRFDPNTEYRFASIVSGTWRSNLLTLAVAYAQDRYALEASLQGGKLQGRWKQTDPEDHGVFSASRERPLPPPPGARLAALYEWVKESDGALRYELEGASPAAGWTRAKAPLGRVWVAP